MYWVQTVLPCELFALLHRDGGLKHITDITTSLAGDDSVKEYLNGNSKWNLKDQNNVGTEEDMSMAYNKSLLILN